jgi:hypothetical protein
MDLFEHAMNERLKDEAPLAARMRPQSLDEIVGQEHIVGPGKLLRRAIQAVCEGRDPGDLTTMDDPAALQQIRDLMA